MSGYLYGLQPETTYQFRWVAVGQGGISAGQIATVTTAPAPPSAPDAPQFDQITAHGALDRAEALAKAIRSAKVTAEVTVVVDEMPAPSDGDSDTQKWVFERIQKGKQWLRQHDVEVVDSTEKTIRLAENVEKDLKETEPLPQTTMALP